MARDFMTSKQQHATGVCRSAPGVRSRVLCLLFLAVLFALALHPLGYRLAGQARFHRAKGLLRAGYAGLALVELQKAAADQPNDDEIRKALGKTFSKLGELALKRSDREAFKFFQKSREAYLSAEALNPLDPYTAYGIARAEMWLKKLYPTLHPGREKALYHPASYFKKAIRLRPNNVFYRYAYAYYLYRQGRNEELISIVRQMARNNPLTYDYLKKEAFWSPEVEKACREGIEEALRENNRPRDAWMALSSMDAGKGKWSAAIGEYEKALRVETGRNRAEDFVHLGSLCLKNGHLRKARAAFFKALDLSRERGRLMEWIYYLYRQQGLSDAFEQVYHDADHAFVLPSGTKILLARTLMDLKEDMHAQRILQDYVKKKPEAEAYYWLARAYRETDDWDNMELAVQKATVLAPKNGRYHLLFSQVLAHNGKLKDAEAEADLAIRYQQRPSPWPFNQRAWIRWARKDVKGALRDWMLAISLKKNHPGFYAHAGDALVRLGHDREALTYYEKAIELAPDNENYWKRYRKMKKQVGQLPNMEPK